ncbi:MAG: 2,3-bisphosphoglycerate-dependent phosphoglycerate mutase [Patescibacteria group bacterium]|nr:histidine phosphatase family protein [Candidatus Saccharibacteria bacterium]MDQ5963560.1 2,3-bisphosphoglycerate-dependent phosphoglycerate mutase [Patescibacteria group bacterium]
MNRFYLVRHGKTLNNLAGRLSGWLDTPLTPDGLEPTKAVTKKLNGVEFDAVYSSDLGRAFITAYQLAQELNIQQPIHKTAGLREVNYGLAANLLTKEAYELYPSLDRDTAYAPPEGETLQHMQQRTIQTITEISGTYEDATILLVAHSGVMAALYSHVHDTDFGQHNISEAYDHDCIITFTFDGNDIASLHKY